MNFEVNTGSVPKSQNISPFVKFLQRSTTIKFTCEGGIRYVYKFNIELFTQNGEEYMKLINPSATYTLKGVHYKLDNLFNGDKRLGEEMNKVLNENWEVVNQDLSQSVGKTNAEVCFSIANAYFTKIPLKEIFPQ